MLVTTSSFCKENTVEDLDDLLRMLIFLGCSKPFMVHVTKIVQSWTAAVDCCKIIEDLLKKHVSKVGKSKSKAYEVGDFESDEIKKNIHYERGLWTSFARFNKMVEFTKVAQVKTFESTVSEEIVDRVLALNNLKFTTLLKDANNVPQMPNNMKNGFITWYMDFSNFLYLYGLGHMIDDQEVGKYLPEHNNIFGSILQKAISKCNKYYMLAYHDGHNKGPIDGLALWKRIQDYCFDQETVTLMFDRVKHLVDRIRCKSEVEVEEYLSKLFLSKFYVDFLKKLGTVSVNMDSSYFLNRIKNSVHVSVLDMVLPHVLVAPDLYGGAMLILRKLGALIEPKLADPKFANQKGAAVAIHCYTMKSSSSPPGGALTARVDADKKSDPIKDKKRKASSQGIDGEDNVKRTKPMLPPKVFKNLSSEERSQYWKGLHPKQEELEKSAVNKGDEKGSEGDQAISRTVENKESGVTKSDVQGAANKKSVSKGTPAKAVANPAGVKLSLTPVGSEKGKPPSKSKSSKRSKKRSPKKSRKISMVEASTVKVDGTPSAQLDKPN